MTSSSYFLERDGLGSGRRVIDANSNATLLPSASHLTYRSSYGTTSPLPYTTNTSYAHLGYGSSSSAIETSDAKKMLAEVRPRPSESHHVTLLFRLVARSNASAEKRHGEERRIDSRTVIDQVSVSKKVFLPHRSFFLSSRDATKIERLEPIKYEPLPAHERAALDAARRELDQCRTKLEGVSFEVRLSLFLFLLSIDSVVQLRETTIKLSGKDERINELKHEIESLRREFDLVNQGNQQLRVRVHELESNVNCYDSVANKSSITITSLQKEAKEKQEQLIDLQARVRSVHRGLSLFVDESCLVFRTHMEEREASERKTESLYKKLQEVFTRLNITVGMDLGQPGPASFDLLMTKVRSISRVLLKGQGVLDIRMEYGEHQSARSNDETRRSESILRHGNSSESSDDSTNGQSIARLRTEQRHSSPSDRHDQSRTRCSIDGEDSHAHGTRSS